MALKVRSGSVWHTVNGAYVMSGGVWKPLRFLYVAERTYTEPPQGDDEEPVTRTVWRLARAFEPPSTKPGPPYVTEFREHEGDEPPPQIDLRIQFLFGGAPYGNWPFGVQGLEVWISENGEYSLLSRITDPEATEVWVYGNAYTQPTAIQVRFRFINDAGPGPWSNESSVYYVQPGGY